MADRPRTGIMSDTFAGIRTDLILFVIGFFLAVFIGNRFGPKGLGFFSMALTLYILGVLACTSGLTLAFIPKLREAPESEKRRLMTTALFFAVFFGMAATLLGFLASNRIAQAFDIYDMWRVVCLVSLSYIPAAFNETLIGLLPILENHKTANRYRIRKRVVFVIIAVVMFVTGNIYLVLASFFVSDLILAVYLIRQERIWFFPFDFTGFSDTAPGLFLDSMRSSFSGSAGEVNAHVDILIIGYFMTATKVGIYAAAILIARLVLLPWEVIREVVLTRWEGGGDASVHPRAASDIRRYFPYGMAAMLVIAITAAIMYDNIIGALFPGGDYLESKRAFLFLLPGIMLYGATTIYEGILAMSGRSEAVGSISIQTLLINVILGLLLVHAFGIAGAALAGTLSFFWYYLAVTETLGELNMKVNRWGTILYGVVSAGIALFLFNLIGASLLTAMMSAVLTILMLVYVEYLDLTVKIGGVAPMDVIKNAKTALKDVKEKRKLH